MPDDRKARHRDFSAGLLRQRRNLLLVSLLLPLFFISGAEIEKINILGTIITVNNPSIIKASLFMFYLYFLLRYWQYYKEEIFVKDMKSSLHKHLHTWPVKYLNNAAREKASFLQSSFLRVAFADPRYSLGTSFSAISQKKDQVIFPFFRKCEFYIYPARSNEGHIPEAINRFHKIMANHINWVPIYAEDNDTPSFYREYLYYNIFRFNFLRFIGYSKFVLSESYFTDYQLPFIVALSSAFITLYAIFLR